MTQHVTISLDEADLERARMLAASRGVPVEEYLQNLVEGHLQPASNIPLKVDISAILGIGESTVMTNVAIDKHSLIGDAVSNEYLEETRRK